jgi:hypothetical protein
MKRKGLIAGVNRLNVVMFNAAQLEQVVSGTTSS